MKITTSKAPIETKKVCVKDAPRYRWFWLAAFDRYGFKGDSGVIWYRADDQSVVIFGDGDSRTQDDFVELMPDGFSITFTNDPLREGIRKTGEGK